MSDYITPIQSMFLDLPAAHNRALLVYQAAKTALNDPDPTDISNPEFQKITDLENRIVAEKITCPADFACVALTLAAGDSLPQEEAAALRKGATMVLKSEGLTHLLNAVDTYGQPRPCQEAAVEASVEISQGQSTKLKGQHDEAKGEQNTVPATPALSFHTDEFSLDDLLGLTEAFAACEGVNKDHSDDLAGGIWDETNEAFYARPAHSIEDVLVKMMALYGDYISDGGIYAPGVFREAIEYLPKSSAANVERCLERHARRSEDV